MGFSSFAFAQEVEGKVGINTPADQNPQATLDIVAKTSSGAAKEGILIPRVTSEKAKAMGVDVEESTLVYITDGVSGSESETTSLVGGAGFYYYKRGEDGNRINKWIKVNTNTGAVYVLPGSLGNLRHYKDSSLSEGNYLPNDYMIVLENNALNGNIALPPAEKNKGRVIYLLNGVKRGLGFAQGTPSVTPFNFRTIAVSSSVGFVSDGTTWYVIGR
ncbi:hypothetical protein ACQ1Q9_07995 [Ornithobacterium rhinotracheale]